MLVVNRAGSEVAERRRARPCRVLLVDETSIRRQHRYVTEVACGDSGKVLAMIPGRTKRSLARFFRDQGAWWCRQVEIVVSDGSRSYQAAIAQYLPDARHVLDRFHEILAYHNSRPVSNGPIEGINNLLQVLRRRRPRVQSTGGPPHPPQRCTRPWYARRRFPLFSLLLLGTGHLPTG